MNRTTITRIENTSGFLPQTKGLLQRKYYCGNKTIESGECTKCANKKTTLQRKLSIGASNDPLELEANRVVDEVMAMSSNHRLGRTQSRIQRFTAKSSGQSVAVPQSVDHVIAGTGQPISPVLRQDMEQRFGHDFSNVQVHTGSVAEQSAYDISAQAYTVSNNIVFGAGQFSPGTHQGRRLLAHELTHVVQQSSANSASFNTVLKSGTELSTEEIRDAGVPLPGGVPEANEESPSPLVEEPAHSCVPIGRFTSIPSGTVRATATASNFGASFNMNAEFSAPIPCNCSCGEYRQFVRGFGSINGTDVTHALCGKTMSRTAWYEDCKTVGGTNLKYGYHSIPFATSRFTNPDQANGCNFNGFDAPGFPLAGRATGDKLKLHLEFKGYLVDACNNDKRFKSASWTVAGKHTVT